ncbi:MAG: hypothetical protein CMJ78_00100 [Planctomycetaceae bacterium]|nr:hypothetical protein [Planctomycetaceae bacterium]
MKTCQLGSESGPRENRVEGEEATGFALKNRNDNSNQLDSDSQVSATNMQKVLFDSFRESRFEGRLFEKGGLLSHRMILFRKPMEFV